MVYEKQTWTNLPSKTTPISANRLNHLETQYDQAISEVSNDASRTALGVASLTRGLLTEVTDMDTLRMRAHVGAYSARLANLVNAPAEITGNPVCNFEVFSNISNAVTQRLACEQGTWWRTADGNTAFFPWRRSLDSRDQTVASEDPYAPLEDGQTLLVISEDHTETVWPTGRAGFTERFGGSKFGWRSRGDGRGEVYTLNMATRRALTWDKFDNTLDADVTGMAEITNAVDGTFGAGVAVRVAGDHDDRSCVFAVIRRGGATGDQLAIITSRNGGTTIHTTVDFPWSIGDTVLVRLRVQGADARAKAWKLGEREPSDWMAEAVTPLTDPGAVGIYAHGIHARHQALEVEAL